MKTQINKLLRVIIVFVMVGSLPACAQTQLASHYAKKVASNNKSKGRYKVGNPYQIKGKWYKPQEKFRFVETGIASWYGPGFHGKHTANGEVYDQYELTAAHKTLQMPSLVRVTNLENGRAIVVRINDRGPFHPGRVIDLSSRGADLLGFKGNGTAKVRLEVLEEESRLLAEAAKAGKDTARIDLASLKQDRVNVRVQKPQSTRKPAVLMDDAEMLPRPKNAGEQPVLVSAEPLDLSVEPVEVQALENVRVENISLPAASDRGEEMAFLNDLDFLKHSQVPGHMEEGRFIPDPVVEQQTPQPSNIYIQAGAFGSYSNAERLAGKLSGFGVANINEAVVDGTRFYRVRLGPVATVNAADRLLARVIDKGYENARIIVD